MKKPFLVVLFLLAAIGLSAQTDDGAYAIFKKDSTYYLIGDQVNIRASSDTSGKILSRLSIGEKLTIIERSDEVFEKNGYSAPWYKVSYLDMDVKMQGYVWGGYIASKTIPSITDRNLLYMYAPLKVVKKEYYDELTLQVRVCKNNVQLAKLEIRALGGIYTYNEAESIGKKGVDGIKDIFKINFSDGFCAGAFGDAYFFWDGSKLFHAKTLHEGFDAPYFWNNDFIFPADAKGKKGYILQIDESGFHGDDDKLTIESYQRITHKWNGTALVTIKTEKKK